MIRAIVVGILLVFVLWMLGIWNAYGQSIGGVQCTTIRNLTYPERKYWIWRLGLSKEQVKQIRITCSEIVRRPVK